MDDCTEILQTALPLAAVGAVVSTVVAVPTLVLLGHQQVALGTLLAGLAFTLVLSGLSRLQPRQS